MKIFSFSNFYKCFKILKNKKNIKKIFSIRLKYKLFYVFYLFLVNQQLPVLPKATNPSSSFSIAVRTNHSNISNCPPQAYQIYWIYSTTVIRAQKQQASSSTRQRLLPNIRMHKTYHLFPPKGAQRENDGAVSAAVAATSDDETLLFLHLHAHGFLQTFLKLSYHFSSSLRLSEIYHRPREFYLFTSSSHCCPVSLRV